MSNQSSELATIETPQFTLSSFEEMTKMAKYIGESKMLGIKTEAEAMTLMLICQAEGRPAAMALLRYHLTEDGKAVRRSDSMQADFEEMGGGIIWHVRTDEMVAATFFRNGKDADTDEGKERAQARFELQWELETLSPDNQDKKASARRAAILSELNKLSRRGEITVLRTYIDAQTKGITDGKNGLKKNWRTSPRQMLQARVVTEGVRLVRPGLISGVYTQDEADDATAAVREEQEAAETARKAAGEAKQEQAKQNVTAAIKQRQEAAGEVTEVTADSWREVKIHIGKANGPLVGKTVGDITDGPLEAATKLINYLNTTFVKECSDKVTAFGAETVSEKDRNLCAAVKHAVAYVAERVAKESETPAAEVVSKEAALPEKQANATTVSEETKQEPAAQETVTDSADWRAAQVPFPSKIEGRRLDSFPEFRFVRAIRNQMLDKPDIVKTAPSKTELKKFQALYELAWSDLGLDLEEGDTEGLLKLVRSKIKPAADKADMKEGAVCATATNLKLLPELNPQPKLSHLANYSQDDLRGILYKLPELLNAIANP